MVTEEEYKICNEQAKAVLREIKSKNEKREMVKLQIPGIAGYVEVLKYKYDSDREYYDNIVKKGIPISERLIP